MLIWLVASAALAQDTADLPRLDTQLFRPSIDAQRTLWSDDTHVGPDGYGAARAIAQYANGLWLDREGYGDADRIVSDVLQVDLMGGYTFRGLRLGLDLPTYALATSQYTNNTAGLGDLAVDLKGGILDRDRSPVGLALAGRLVLPTATVQVPLGASATSWEVEAIVDREFGDLLLIGNVGTRGVPAQEVGDLSWGDAFFGRVGAGYAIGGAGGVSAELASQGQYRLLDNAAGVPLELMAGGWRKLVDDLVVRGGVSAGLTTAVGSPLFRAMLGVSWEPNEHPDRDLDGLVDRQDLCPDDAEDFDSWEDADGCPDPSVPVRMVLQGAGGEPVGLAETVLRTPAGEEIVVRGAEAELELHPGDWTVSVDAVGFEPTTRELFVPLGAARTVTTQLAPQRGELQMFAVDSTGAVIADARVSVSGEEAVALGQRLDLAVGEHALVVTAPGHEAATAQVVIAPGGRHELGVVLSGDVPAPRARLAGDRIEIGDRVYFALNEARLLPESRPVLDAVATVLREHPEIARIRVEGHTDARGPAKFNTELSQDRADEVRAYLIRQGISPERLIGKGYGSSRPLVSDAEADDNRRVEFVVVDAENT